MMGRLDTLLCCSDHCISLRPLIIALKAELQKRMVKQIKENRFLHTFKESVMHKIQEKTLLASEASAVIT